MALVLTSGPSTEPITVAQAKAHLRIDDATQDILIASLILTSRLHIEAALGLALIQQSWRLTLDTAAPSSPPPPAITLPLSPVITLSSIRTTAADGTVTTLAPSAARLDPGPPARVIAAASSWPSAATVSLAFVAGFGPAAADVPAPIRQALLLLVAHWYEHRDPIEIGCSDTAIPQAVSSLLHPYRRPRLA
jgi:uncharacterized phiE125 gp8 family phage protein